MEPFDHAIWIGGPPGSGKTTIATRIARRYGLRWYNADTRTWAHLDRALREGVPAAIAWQSMPPEERWAGRTPAELDELSLDRERGPMILDDVRRLPAAPLVVAEGTPLRPDLVAPVLSAPSRSVWLVLTPELHRARLESCGARESAIQRSLLLSREIRERAIARGLPVLTVDGSVGIDDAVAAAEEILADALAAGPRVATLRERRLLLRQANAAIAAQVRGYLARPWAEGDPEAVVRMFLCECGDTACEASVEVAVGASAAGPVLAPGHGDRAA